MSKSRKSTQKPSRKSTERPGKARTKKVEAATEATEVKAKKPQAAVAEDAPPAAEAPEAPASASREREAATTIKVPKRMKDERLPAVGTKLEKRDRQGAIRCEAVVEEAGIRYNGQLYRSLSAAASAAASDIGIKGSQNGFIFWGLVKPRRPSGDVVERTEKAWRRYCASIEALNDASLPDDTRAKLRAAAKKHEGSLEQLLQHAV